MPEGVGYPGEDKKKKKDKELTKSEADALQSLLDAARALKMEVAPPHAVIPVTKLKKKKEKKPKRSRLTIHDGSGTDPANKMGFSGGPLP